MGVTEIKKTSWTKYREDVDQVEFSDMGGGMRWDHYSGKSFGRFSV